MKKYDKLVGCDVYTVYNGKPYKGRIIETGKVKGDYVLHVEWKQVLEKNIIKKKSLKKLDTIFSVKKDIGKRIWFLEEQVCV